MYNNLCIFSYNSRGFNSSKQDFLKTLTVTAGNSLAVICNQENFLLKANEYIAKKALPGHHIFFNPATKDGLNGRPKNGMFVAVPECLKELVKEVSPPSKRMQSLMFNFQACKILLINTYFPTDPKTTNFDETDLELLLSQIRDSIIHNDFDQMILTGDINADFRRNTRFVKVIDNFIAEMNLCKSWERYSIDFTHVSELNGTTYTSTLDHFLWNQTANSSITDAGVIHLPENMSDHCPVFCNISIPIIRQQVQAKDSGIGIVSTMV